jgi:hypothetical protein
MRLSDRADALRELGAPSLLPPTHVAQVREERHRGLVVAWTSRPNELVDPPPGLTFTFREVSGIPIAGGLLFAFTFHTFEGFTLSSGFPSVALQSPLPW